MFESSGGVGGSTYVGGRGRREQGEIKDEENNKNCSEQEKEEECVFKDMEENKN